MIITSVYLTTRKNADYLTRFKFMRVIINAKLQSYFLRYVLIEANQGSCFFNGIKLLTILSHSVLTAIFFIQKKLERSVFPLQKQREIKSFYIIYMSY